MISDYEYTKKKNIVQKPRKASETRRWYSDSQKLEAVKCWLICGSITQTAAALNIPLPTLKEWRYSRWWQEIATDLRSEDNMQLTARLKKIAAKSLDLVEDRLENGDWVLNQKTGKLMQKPVNLRDLGVISNSTIQNIGKLEDKPQQEQDNKKVVDQLTLLAKKFEEFSKAKRPVQVTDVIFVENDNAIHD